MSAYIKIFYVGLQETLQYRLRLLIDLIIGFLPIVIHILLWSAIYSSSGLKEISGYSFSEMVAYLITMTIVSNYIRTGRVERKIANDIKSGAISKFLLKPINNMGYYIFSSMAENLFYLLFIFCPVFLAMNYIFLGNQTIINIVLCLIALVMAYLLHFIFNYLLGILAYWFTNVSSFFYMKAMILQFISGGVMPLSFFPKGMVSVMNYLPFKYMIYFPINAFLNAGIEEIIEGLLMQLMWLIIFFIVSKIIWFFGLKKYTAVGN